MIWPTLVSHVFDEMATIFTNKSIHQQIPPTNPLRSGCHGVWCAANTSIGHRFRSGAPMKKTLIPFLLLAAGFPVCSHQSSAQNPTSVQPVPQSTSTAPGSIARGTSTVPSHSSNRDQTEHLARIEGHVYKSGRPAARVTITLVADTNFTLHTKSDRHGFYVFRNLVASKHVVTVTTNDASKSSQELNVPDGRVVTQDLKME
jgi:hypothetical protein